MTTTRCNFLYFAFLILIAPMTIKSQMLPKNSTVRLLALGDSYTIGESVAELQRWPEQLIGALRQRGYTCAPPEIVAVTGWRTDDLRRAIDSRKLSGEYNLVSLLIGVNNQYQSRSVSEYEKEFADLLDQAVTLAAGDRAKVFVLSIPDYAYTPFGEKNKERISQDIDRFNSINQKIANDRKITYVNITDISRRGLTAPDLIAEDGLHPSGKMYALWVERILQDLGL